MNPNWLILILLIFNVYSKMIKLDALFLSIIEYAMAIKKIVNKIQKYTIL